MNSQNIGDGHRSSFEKGIKMVNYMDNIVRLTSNKRNARENNNEIPFLKLTKLF